MGNLLGAPITEKETHRGTTPAGIEYGVSSMQGWRIHMEDAHICLDNIYAEYEEEGESQEDKNEVKNKSATENSDETTNGERQRDSEDIRKSPAKKLKRTTRIPVENTSIFAVFDGHGGTIAAEYSAKHFPRVLSRRPKFVEYAKMLEKTAQKKASGDSNDQKNETTEKEAVFDDSATLNLLKDALRDAFMELDREFLLYIVNGPSSNDFESPETEENKINREKDESGTTAVVVILTPDWIVCSNAGDSRSIYSKELKKFTELSFDHKPDDQKERDRIENAGGYVSGGRVDGDLAVSRGLGDFRFKACIDLKPEWQRVSPVPDIIAERRNDKEDQFILVACDGIWDVLTNLDAADLVSEIFMEGETDVGIACEETLDLCLACGSKDNMTALIVKLPGLKIGSGGGVSCRRGIRKRHRRDRKEKMDLDPNGS